MSKIQQKITHKWSNNLKAEWTTRTSVQICGNPTVSRSILKDLQLTPGFQKSSAKITRSAVCRVIPMLAAVMDSTATYVLAEYWNFSHSCCRSADGVEPSIRMKLML